MIRDKHTIVQAPAHHPTNQRLPQNIQIRYLYAYRKKILKTVKETRLRDTATEDSVLLAPFFSCNTPCEYELTAQVVAFYQCRPYSVFLQSQAKLPNGSMNSFSSASLCQTQILHSNSCG